VFSSVKVKLRLSPAVAWPDRRPPGPDSASFGWPVMSSSKFSWAVASPPLAAIETGYWPASIPSGGVTLTLRFFDLPASSGSEVSSWLPYCSLNATWKPAGAFERRLTVVSSWPSFFAVTWKSKVEFGVPRRAGSSASSVSFAGSMAFSVSFMGRSREVPSALPVTLNSNAPLDRSSGGVMLSVRSTVLSVGAMAASTPRPSPSICHFQSSGSPLTLNPTRCGGSPLLISERSTVIVSPACAENSGYEVVSHKPFGACDASVTAASWAIAGGGVDVRAPVANGTIRRAEERMRTSRNGDDIMAISRLRRQMLIGSFRSDIYREEGQNGLEYGGNLASRRVA